MYSTSIANYFTSILNRTTTPPQSKQQPQEGATAVDSTPIPKSFIISTPEEKIVRINMKSVKLKADHGGNGDCGNVDGEGVGKKDNEADIGIEDEDFISINKRQLTYAEVASIAVKSAKSKPKSKC
ncbi:hypothetical protein CANMA_002996 [Candida margitis]|uniref:uncharacterized protein n=1 Tax=Candida margitis TaxID=1775924 RepID=UPI0022261C48|nr:uncharacterized protein CANMA_002996 [Candida margitis]KAI5967562.1 hypothetical protein CANMA_002996 [Candida margitis]